MLPQRWPVCPVSPWKSWPSFPPMAQPRQSSPAPETRIVHQPVGGLPGYALVTTAPEDVSGVWGALLAAGVAPMGTEAYDALRVALAVPTYGREMGEQYNPLEAGLIGSIDFTKGCYIGQEVIARLDSYDKVQKHLVTLKFEHAAHVCQGAEMVQEGRVVGVVTSLGTLPDGDLVGIGIREEGLRLDRLKAGPASSVRGFCRGQRGFPAIRTRRLKTRRNPKPPEKQ